jgi:hypothetical protein
VHETSCPVNKWDESTVIHNPCCHAVTIVGRFLLLFFLAPQLFLLLLLLLLTLLLLLPFLVKEEQEGSSPDQFCRGGEGVAKLLEMFQRTELWPTCSVHG